MTNERAIELLNRISDSQFDGIHGDERREALSIAVRVLEQNLVQESDSLVKDLVKDCISRKMAIDAFEPEHDTDWYTPRIIEVLEALPSAQPQRKMGKWMSVSDEMQTWYHCSECHYQQYEKTKFCPSCGADMRGEQDG